MMHPIKMWIICCLSVVLLLPMHLFSVEKISFAEEQNGVKLEVIDCTVSPPFYSKVSNIGTPLVPGLGVQDFTEKGMHPIRISVHNGSAHPITITPKSFRMKLSDTKNIEACFSRADQVLLPILVLLLGGCYSGIPLMIQEAGYIPFSLSNYPISSAWFAVVLGWYFYLGYDLSQMRIKKIEKLEKYFLTKPITIQPGRTIQKIVLLDGTSFHSLFQFFVFNQDQTEYAATFDVELIK